MKAVFAVLLAMTSLSVLALFASFGLSIWTSDDRWAMTGFLLIFTTGVLGLATFTTAQSTDE